MNLTQELTTYRNQFLATQSEQIRSVMAKATSDLINAKIDRQALKVGDRVPKFKLPNAVGNEVELRSILVKGTVVISFYRGSWCPYCNLELRRSLSKYN